MCTDKIKMKSIEFQTHFKSFVENFQVNTDFKRLQQVLLNLLQNAVKFTDRNGKIFLIVEKQVNNFLRISVVDNGEGIKTEDQDKLFRLLGSFKDAREINTTGIGLGLVMSKMIVQKFNGYIDFVSEHKNGSSFFYTFETKDNGQGILPLIQQEQQKPWTFEDLNEDKSEETEMRETQII